MPTSPRKRIETILLALLAILSVVPLRCFTESHVWFYSEMAALLSIFSAAEAARIFGKEWKALPWGKLLAAVGVAGVPIFFAVVARAFGSPIAFEMSALSAFGAMSLSIAMTATTDRTRAMSLVASGFLVLFSTSISDDPRTVVLAIVWLTGCVWFLVANHWEKLEVCMPDSVRPTVGVRPVSVVAAIVLCIFGGWLARDRFTESNRLSFGFMPTSGGSKWSDPAARSGIGTGDAAIAAKDHAESFGAVESDIFLESTESTLFDMMNDTIGEPKMKPNYERRQAMGSENMLPSHEQAAKSEKGGGSFSTDRMPPKEHRHFADATNNAIVQWDGPTGIRLAMHRFDTFDGVDWTHSNDDAHQELRRRDIDKQIWFFDPSLQKMALDSVDAINVNRLKVLRLSTSRLPAPMMTAGLHVKDVDRQDFFGVDSDGSLFMPDREKVPPLTVLNLASIRVMEDELLAIKPAGKQADESHNDSCYQQLRSIVQELRTEFTFDRKTSTSTDDPVGEFLETRRGGDHLFATTAVLKAREIGLESRLVSGFYVRPDSYDMAAGHANVTPEDVHVWAEVKFADGRWFEIEPTPGYQEPIYTPSLWLVTKRFAQAYKTHALAIVCAITLLYLTRRIWIEWLLVATWAFARPLRPKRQLALAMRIVEARAGMTGQRRPVGKPQRDWMESLADRDLSLQNHVKTFCDAADQTFFGGNDRIDRRTIDAVVRSFSARHLKHVTHKAVA